MHYHWRGIMPRDRVRFTTPHGNGKNGTVVISTPTHVVVNVGGRYGTPHVVNENNYQGHITTRNKK